MVVYPGHSFNTVVERSLALDASLPEHMPYLLLDAI